MKLTLEEKVIILNKTVALIIPIILLVDIEKRNPNSNKYFIEGLRYGVTMAIKIFLEQELD